MVGRSAHCTVCAYQGDSASAEPWRLVPGFANGKCVESWHRLGAGAGLSALPSLLAIWVTYALATHQTKPSASQAARQGSPSSASLHAEGVPGKGGGPGVLAAWVRTANRCGGATAQQIKRCAPALHSFLTLPSVGIRNGSTFGVFVVPLPFMFGGVLYPPDDLLLIPSPPVSSLPERSSRAASSAPHATPWRP